MLNQELLLLGILKEGPKHGYEIKKRIKEVIANLALPTINSIYYPLTVLEKNGLVNKKSGQAGRRPQKNIYALTKKGEQRFMELLEESLLVIKKPHFDIDVSLYFLPYVDPKIAIRRLRARQIFLNKIKEGVITLKSSQGENIKSHIDSILEHNLTLVEAEINFISKIIRTIETKV